jgi:DNA segregation ATPase FtsK/SpoIIIE, S-DNA-T family
MPPLAPSPLLNGARFPDAPDGRPAMNLAVGSSTRVEIELLVAGVADMPVAVTVDADPAAPVAALVRSLVDALPGVVEGPLYLGGTRMPPDQPLAATGLTRGALVALGRPVPEPEPTSAADLELAVVGGLGAGQTRPAPAGIGLWIGRDARAHLALGDAEVSRVHATLLVDAGGRAELVDAGSRNGTRWEGHRLDGAATLTDGDVFQVGETVVELRRSPTTAAGGHRLTGHRQRLERDAATWELIYNRQPRITPPTDRPELVVPVRPASPTRRRFPLAAVLLPVLLGAGLLVFGRSARTAPYLLLFALSPLMLLATTLGDHLGGRREQRRTQARHRAALADLHRRLGELAGAEQRATRRALPDLAAVVAIATGPTDRLWERRPSDDDFLRLRLGLVDRPATIRLRNDGRGDEREDVVPPTVRAVPVAVDLTTAGVVGIAGPPAARRAQARALLTQAAALHTPADLGVVVLTGADDATTWSWCGWLPHTDPLRADWAARRLFAVDARQGEARLAELRRLIDERRAEQRANLRTGPPPGRRLLLVVDGARRLRHLRGFTEVLADGPAVGVYALCLDADERDLPDECGATVVAVNRSGTRARVRLPAGEPVEEVLVDGLPEALAERVARALAPIRVLGGCQDAGGVPDAVRLLDLLDGEDLGTEHVRAAWDASPEGRSTTALLGVGADGPVRVDLRTDGPHALVAGTSGAGKSELLQTLVASLALANMPDALAFVLIDYKGGSAFKACKDLPHCVGFVTDLDAHLAARALVCLGAELKRREQLFSDAGAKDIEDYWARTGARLPRLVLVIDEFATLAEELPEFVSGIVGIGMRGRSLGVHLVLATQRPAGVVSADIRANVNLRVCLRVTSDADSSDVIGTAAAARIGRRTPGRAYLRTGHGELAVFQAARVGWPHGAADGGPDDEAPFVSVRPCRVAELGEEPPAPPVAADDGIDTDLETVVSAVTAAAADLALARPASPWPPPLPTLIGLADLGEGELSEPTSPVAVPVGLVDRPASQDQVTFVLDLERTGSVLVAGAVRSGRSTFLRVLAGALATHAGPDVVHLYALDCGNRALAPLNGLPGCGAVVDGDDTQRVTRLISLLGEEIAERQRLLALGGYGSLAEQRAAQPAAALPHLVLLVDRMESLQARYADVDGGNLLARFDQVLRQGPAVGLTVVVASDRTGITHRLASALEARLVLRQADRDDYAALGIDRRDVPARMPAGRAIWTATGEEVQVAVLSDDPAGTAQAEALWRLGDELSERYAAVAPERLPRRLDRLPERITLAEVERLRTTQAPHQACACVVAAGGDHLGPVDLDLAETGGCFVIAGPPRSGRSTALVTIVRSLRGRAAGTLDVLVVAPRPSPLRDLRDLPGVVDVLDRADDVAELEAAVAERAGRPLAVVVDDAELLADGQVALHLEPLVRLARDGELVLVAAGATQDLLLHRYRGWLADVRRTRTGLLLDPVTHTDGEVFDLSLPRSMAGGWPPGRALLVERGATQLVQVAQS